MYYSWETNQKINKKMKNKNTYKYATLFLNNLKLKKKKIEYINDTN